MANPSRPAQTSPQSEPRLKWATSQQVGGVSEIAVLSPIKDGIVPGERRTYEERLRASIANLAKRHQQGIPVELDPVSTIHFGRMIVIRPEQYLYFSKIDGVGYCRDDTSTGNAANAPRMSPREQRLARLARDFSPRNVPERFEDFREVKLRPPSQRPQLRSWLLTLVEFDGELKAYMREIALLLGSDFDGIFANCELYPGSADFETFWLWIRSFQINTDLFYATYPHLSVVRIRQLEAFKRRFDAFVARVRSPTGPLVRSMDEMFDEFLRENHQYASGFPTPGGTYPSEDDGHGG
jgi:hypothetical protein